MRRIARDLRDALRSLRKSPGFVLLTVGTLGLALALNTTMLGVLDAVVHPYVPYESPDQLYSIAGAGFVGPGGPSFREMYELFGQANGLERKMAQYNRRDLALQRGSLARDEVGSYVSPNFFAVLGVRPLLGRTFGGSGADDHTVVLGETLWRTLFAGRRAIDHAVISLDGESYTVIGVVPQAMAFPYGTVLWIPMPTDPAAPSIGAVVRLDSTLTQPAVEARLTAFAARVNLEYPSKFGSPLRFIVGSLRPVPSALDDFQIALAGAVLLVLLIACANVASLIVARGLSRQRELAIRSAVGASRRDIVRQLLAEGLVIGIASGVIGLLLGGAAMGVVRHITPPSVQQLGLIAPYFNWRVFCLGVTLSLGTVLLFGLYPAVRLSRVDLNQLLKESSGSHTGARRHRYSGLVTLEFALSMVLLLGAGLLGRSAARLAGYSYGFDAEDFLTTWVRMDSTRARTDSALEGAYAALAERASRLPGAVAATTFGNTLSNQWRISVEVADGGSREMAFSQRFVVAPNFFSTLGIRVVEGRDFSDGDIAAGGAVIVNEAAARAIWPYGAVGRMVKLGNRRSTLSWRPVVGVVPNVLITGPYNGAGAMIFVASASERSRFRQLLVRRGANSAALPAAIHREVAELSLRLGGLSAVVPLTEEWHELLEERFFLLDLFASFAAFGLLLAAIGLYAVLAHAVGQRLREFAVRASLGATRRDILRLVLHDGFVMVLGGTGAGAFLAFGGAHLLNRWLVGVTSSDATTLVLVEGILFAIALLACIVPALQATRANPAEVLRAS